MIPIFYVLPQCVYQGSFEYYVFLFHVNKRDIQQAHKILKVEKVLCLHPK